MSKWILLTLSVFCLKLFAQQPVTEIPVLVQYQQQWQGYVEQPRIQTVLMQQVKSANVHWPSARLYSLEPEALAELEQTRSQVLEQLRLLIIAAAKEPQLAMQLQETRQQIARWRLAKPVALELNPNLALVRQQHNPKLSKGQYLLVAGKRVSTISVFGLGGERFFMHEQQRPAYAYVQQATELYGDTVWLFSAQKPAREIPVAAWNRTETAIATGTLLFVPLTHNLIEQDFPELNQQIKTLLVHRVPS